MAKKKQDEVEAVVETVSTSDGKQVREFVQPKGNKPLKSPDEWGMLAIKVKTVIREEKDLETGKFKRSVKLVCPELDDAVLVTKDCDYVTYTSNGEEIYHQVPEKRVYVAKSYVKKCEAKGYEVVENAPDWRFFALKAE
ncbi:MAG: hypothetical protein ACREJC_09975 [Tepidisphaeraceae bacterium]